ncbi:MAG TPA: RNA polymerase sigma factor [Terriglobales bacterium]|nr:RNA polymerase sigma factor [Terriglobales bacterium]
MTESRNRLLTAFAEHQQGLMRFLWRRLGNHALAQDLVQETWLRAATASLLPIASASIAASQEEPDPPDRRRAKDVTSPFADRRPIDQEQIADPRRYLYRIAANLAVDHQRHANRGIEVPAEPDHVAAIADRAPSPESVVHHRRELEKLLAAIDRLSPRCREVFLLTKLQGMSYQEVAMRLGISKNTVMVHMTNALAQLADHRE